jgi:hypothetical protein
MPAREFVFASVIALQYSVLDFMFQWALWRANPVYNARFRGDAPGTYLSLIIERFLLVHGQRTFYRKRWECGL